MRRILTIFFLCLSGMCCADDSISLERTGCFGSCPAYKVTIDARGGVTYEGKSCVAVVGLRKTSVPTFRFQRILREAENLSFWNFKSKYDLRDCYTDAGDLPTIAISISRNGNSKSVSYYTGCADKSFPELSKMSALAIDIDSETRIQSLIGNMNQRLKNCED